MSRHRDVRNLDYDQEYEEAYDDTVYGHSVDDHDFGVSPSAEQYLYSQKGDSNHGFGAYFPGTEKIKEEEENIEEPPELYARRDSNSYERPRLSSEDEVRLNSVLDELRNVVGDQFSDAELVKSVLEHKYDFEVSLNAILNLKSSSGQQAESLASHSQAKKEYISVATQPDDYITFCPFAFMLPLSYTFSSAFSFENGKLERISTKQIIKEWYSNMYKNKSKTEKKSISKESYDLENSRDDSESVSMELSMSPSNSGDCSVSEIERSDSSSKVYLLSKDDLTKTDIKIFLQDNSKNAVKEDITTKLQNIHVQDSLVKGTVEIPSLSRDRKNFIPPLTLGSHNKCEGESNRSALSISSPKGNLLRFGSPNDGVNSKFDSSQENKMSKLSSLASAHLSETGKTLPLSINKNNTRLPVNSGISVSPLERQFGGTTNKFEGNFNFGIPSLSSPKKSPLWFGSPNDNFSDISQDLKISKLSSLASAHLNETGRTLPLGINKSNSCSPMGSNICHSPLDKQSNLLALATAHFEHNVHKVGGIPSFSSSGFCERGPSKEINENRLTIGSPVEIAREIKSQIPSLIKPNPQERFPFNSKNQIASIKKQRVLLHESSDELDMEIEDSIADNNYGQNMTIDLNIALLDKNKEALNESEQKNDNTRDSVGSHLFLGMNIPVSLSKEERKLLASQPFSLCGRTILKTQKKIHRLRYLSIASVTVPYKPFDFSSRSPDDTVKESILEKSTSKSLRA